MEPYWFREYGGCGRLVIFRIDHREIPPLSARLSPTAFDCAGPKEPSAYGRLRRRSPAIPLPTVLWKARVKMPVLPGRLAEDDDRYRLSARYGLPSDLSPLCFP